MKHSDSFLHFYNQNTNAVEKGPKANLLLLKSTRVAIWATYYDIYDNENVWSPTALGGVTRQLVKCNAIL